MNAETKNLIVKTFEERRAVNGEDEYGRRCTFRDMQNYLVHLVQQKKLSGVEAFVKQFEFLAYENGGEF